MKKNDFGSLLLNESLKALTDMQEKQLATTLANVFETIGPARTPPYIPESGGGFGKTGGITIIVNNNASTTVSAQEKSGPFDEKYLEITIDQMVANSLLRGRQTSGVMQSLFGVAPGLIGR